MIVRAVRQDNAPVSLGTAATVNLSVAQESKLVPRAMHGANTSEEGGKRRARKLMEGHPTKSKWGGCCPTSRARRNDPCQVAAPPATAATGYSLCSPSCR